MSEIKIIKDNMLALAHDPSAMLTLSLERLRNVQSGETYVLTDPTDPVVFLAEQGVLYSHTTIEGMREIIPKVFPNQAVTFEDLYRHMNDRSLIGVWATPAETELTLYIDVDSFINKAIPADIQVIRKLIIPRDTQWMVSGYTFTSQYPIEIQYLPYSTPENPAFQVLWLTTVQSPIRPVATNALEHEVVEIPNMSSKLLRIRIPVMQYEISTISDTLVADTEFRLGCAFKDRFYYARVWARNANSQKWEEIHTTHSKENYNPLVPTAYLSVIGQTVYANVPSVYMTSGLLNGEIRLDVYSTKGELSLDLSAFNQADYKHRFDDLNGEISGTYYNPLRTMGVFNVLGEGWCRGGKNSMDFEKLRSRIIDDAAGDRSTPITDAQLTHRIEEYGLKLSRPIDYTPSTGRAFQMSDYLPEPSMKELHSAMGSISSPLYFTIDELSILPTVRNNGNRFTVLPETIYRTDNANIIIDADMTERWRTLPKTELVNRGNGREYYYTPFHYVVDTNNEMIDVRLYQLDKPVVDAKRFIDTNTTTELSVVTGDYRLEFNERGYVLTVVTKSQPSYQALSDSDCWAQLSFKPRGEYSDDVFITGSYIGTISETNERVFEFVIATNLDVDRNDELIITNGRTANNPSVEAALPLLTEFNLLYGVDNYYPHYYERSPIDDKILPPTRDSKAVTHEVLKIRIGNSLNALWCKSRPETDSIRYKYYAEDVYAFWETDVIERNEDLTAKMEKNPETGKLEFVYQHRAGDPKLDAEGNHIILHKRGSQVIGPGGLPIIDKPRSIIYRCEMPTFDARFIFANTAEIIRYRETVVQHVVDRVVKTMAEVGDKLIDMSQSFYLPTPTMGLLQARLQDGSIAPIPAENRFTISYYLSAANRKDTKLLSLIKNRTTAAISKWLAGRKTISATDMGENLKTLLKDSIISVEIGDFGPDQNLRLYTIVSETGGATLGKKLDLEPDGSVSLKDDVVIAFNRHDQQL